MKLPVPNAEEVTRMQALYLEEFGVELSREQAYDVLRNVMQFIYLTEYEPIRPLRP